jgi:hypothetical protein
MSLVKIFLEAVKFFAEESKLDALSRYAFAGGEEDLAEPQEVNSPMDALVGGMDISPNLDSGDKVDEEADLLEQMPLPGNPKTAQERRAKWLKISRRARIVIHRLHRNLRHLPKQALIDMLKATKSQKWFIDAAKNFRCESCTVSKPIATRHKVAPPSAYTMNLELGVDVIDIKDANDTHYNLLNVTCHGTAFQQAYVVRVADIHGVPSSSSCLNAFTKGWVKWAGWPKQVACDRALHNRGVFGQTLSSKGIRIRPAALESPEHIGRTRRRGDLLKKMMKKVITETKAGEEAIDVVIF